MPPEPIIIDDSDYASSEDSDFAPESATILISSDSSDLDSEAENKDDKQTKKPKAKAGKRKRLVEEAEDVSFQNSGDEAIVEKGLKRQKKKGKKGREGDDEGGEGGFVRTRRMAAMMLEEKRPLANTISSTVDVDALWRSMTRGTPMKIISAQTTSPSKVDTDEATTSSSKDTDKDQSGDAMIKIQRTYTFAGKLHTEEKLVPANSAEAILHLQTLSSHPAASSPSLSHPNSAGSFRPLRKARRSIFEPVIADSLPQRTDLHLGASNRNTLKAGGSTGTGQAKKLNTVEKSKMDWAGFVDKEGIQDELGMAGKARGAYLPQKEFLARVQEKREEEARRARMKG